MKSIGVYLFDSLGSALKATNKVSCYDQLQILESIPLGRRAQLIVQGPAEQIKQLHKEIETVRFLKHQVIENMDPRVWQSYQALINADVLDYLYVIESEFLGDLFVAAGELFQQGLQCVDLRMPRSSEQGCYLLMTGAALVKIENLNCKTTVIEKTSSGLKEFFNLKPKC